MKSYKPEIILLVIIVLISITGFWELYFGENAHANGFHHLHVGTSWLWLLLLLYQLVLIDKKQYRQHKKIGLAIFMAGPLIVATLTLLSVYSAKRASEAGTIDTLLIQNVASSAEVGILIFLGFMFRKNAKLHGSFLLSSSLIFLGIALFFSLLSFVPHYKIEGPETFGRFGEAAAMGTFICVGVAVLMFLKDIRNGWPWLIAAGMFFLNSSISSWLREINYMQPLTDLVGAPGLVQAFSFAFIFFLLLVMLAWKFGGRSGRRVMPA